MNFTLQILDGGSLTSPLLAKAFCNRSETLTLRTSQNIMLIRFKTNGEVYEGGFNALYSAGNKNKFNKMFSTSIFTCICTMLIFLY